MNHQASFYINGFYRQISQAGRQYDPVTFFGEIVFDILEGKYTGELVDTQASRAKIQKFVFEQDSYSLSVRYLLSQLEYTFTFKKASEDMWEGTYESQKFGSGGEMSCILVKIPPKILPALIQKHSDQHAIRQYVISA